MFSQTCFWVSQCVKIRNSTKKGCGICRKNADIIPVPKSMSLVIDLILNLEWVRPNGCPCVATSGSTPIIEFVRPFKLFLSMIHTQASNAEITRGMSTCRIFCVDREVRTLDSIGTFPSHTSTSSSTPCLDSDYPSSVAQKEKLILQLSLIHWEGSDATWWHILQLFSRYIN